MSQTVLASLVLITLSDRTQHLVSGESVPAFKASVEQAGLTVSSVQALA